MVKVIKKICCADGTDPDCSGTLEIEVGTDYVAQHQSLIEYADETGQDTVCPCCGSDRTYAYSDSL